MEVKYLSDNLELKTLEISDVLSSPSNGGAAGDAIESKPTGISTEEETSAKKVWKYPLVTLSGVPEVKVETRYRRVDVPFDGHIDVPYPVTCTRKGKHWLEAKVFYPSDLAGDTVKIIEKCAEKAAIKAAAVVVVGCIEPTLLPPAIPSAKVLFIQEFKSCLAEETFKLVNYDITYEHESGDWSC
ncbi:hypothetical protein ACTJJD_12565 [Bacillus sp. 22446]|uniref:hypothetical protein n=1 Tax=Bacillus sp. 22446 TaxID=3453918 RepID=UPI003F85E13F